VAHGQTKITCALTSNTHISSNNYFLANNFFVLLRLTSATASFRDFLTTSNIRHMAVFERTIYFQPPDNKVTVKPNFTISLLSESPESDIAVASSYYYNSTLLV
jgi:hypothetical protein